MPVLDHQSRSRSGGMPEEGKDEEGHDKEGGA
jgi:hypothetical protein